MQAGPAVSEFFLDPPHIPSLIRSRSRFPPPKPTKPTIYKQIMVEVKESVPRTKQFPRQRIRKQIDSCLEMIEEKLHKSQWKQKKGIDTKEGSQSTIHRVDNRLVLAYLSILRDDYSLKGCVQETNCSPAPRSSFSVQQSRRKQFLQLTQSSRLERMRSQVHNKRDSLNTPTRHNLSSGNRPMATQAVRVDKPDGERRQFGYRYCVGCEQRISLEDIEEHVRVGCNGFKGLYQMSFQQLSFLVKGKATRIVGQLRRQLQNLTFKDRKSTLNQTIRLAQEYLDSYELNSEQIFESQFGWLKLRNIDADETIQQIRKLHQFRQIYVMLRAAESGRLCSPKQPQYRKMSVPSSPIAGLGLSYYFHLLQETAPNT